MSIWETDRLWIGQVLLLPTSLQMHCLALGSPSAGWGAGTCSAKGKGHTGLALVLYVGEMGLELRLE